MNEEKFFVDTSISKKEMDHEDSEMIEECWRIKELIHEESMKILTKDKMD